MFSRSKVIYNALLTLILVSAAGGIVGTLQSSKENFEALESLVAALIGHVTLFRLFLFVLALIALLAIIKSISTKNRPITVLRTEISYKFCDASGKLARISRVQYIMANHPNVTAYFLSVTPTFGGTVLTRTLVLKAFIQGKPISDSRPVIFERGNAVEIIQEFPSGLPFCIWNMIVPNPLLRSWIRFNRSAERHPSFIVKRVMELTIEDEHTGLTSFHELQAARYILKDTRIAIHFHPDRLPIGIDQDFVAHRIKNAGISTVFLHREEGGNDACVYCCELPSIRDERIRITFNFSK